MKKFFTLLMIGILSLSLISCGKEKEEPIVSDEPEVSAVEKEADTQEKEKNTSHEGQTRSYLTGEWVDSDIAKTRAVAVMLNNIEQAVPQSGIENADVVYEAPVEGGITRLMGIFENYKNLEKIGSVRSCRTYYLYYMLEFDAMYVHCGQANYALDLLNQDFVNNLSSLSSEGSTVFYKTTDRVAPHNTYTSGEGILAGADLMKYKTSYDDSYDGHYKFNTDDEKQIELTNGQTANIVKPGYLLNKPWFEYNSKDGLYYRYQYGDKQIDDMTNNQLAYKNIIFQYSGVQSYYGTEYLDIDTTSGGDGVYFTNGKAINVTWKKDSEYGVTRYYNQDDEEITLNTGKTWVCIIDKDAADRVEILESDENSAE